ncbi:hypothetical protein [Streptomyces sp. NPDC127119]|uniref:hypothetical protein n=1 Tax=Streptomyces sp. NPDC127119 TaxID=3345370 RepID=UPI003629575F
MQVVPVKGVASLAWETRQEDSRKNVCTPLPSALDAGLVPSFAEGKYMRQRARDIRVRSRRQLRLKLGLLAAFSALTLIGTSGTASALPAAPHSAPAVPPVALSAERPPTGTPSAETPPQQADEQKITSDTCSPASLKAKAEKAEPLSSRAPDGLAGRTIITCTKVNAPGSAASLAARAEVIRKARSASGNTDAERSVSLNKAKTAGAAADDVGVLEYVDPPSWCFDHAFSGWWYTRSQECQIRDITVVYLEIVNGRPIEVGTAKHIETSYIYMSGDIDNIINQIRINKYFAERAGTIDFWGLQQIRGWATCSGDCKPISDTGLRTGNYTRNRNNDGEAAWEPSHDEVGAITHLAPTWNYYVTAAGFEPSETVTVPPPPQIRCDNAFSTDGNDMGDYVPGTSVNSVFGAGCAVPVYVPTWIIYKNGLYPTVGWHVEAAQNSGLPGLYPSGDPLHRLTDSTKKRQNGDRACPPTPTWVRPANKQCDEYPMRSTYEGASTANPAGTARTFAPPIQTMPTGEEWCEMDAAWAVPTGVTGPLGWSSCMLPSTDNSHQGAFLGGFYKTNRVLDNDPFRVWVQ